MTTKIPTALLLCVLAACDRREVSQVRADSTVSTVPSAAEHARILFFGTSLTAGLGVDPDEAYPALLQKRFDSLALEVEVVNAGVSGETSAAGLRRIDWLLREPVAVLVLELGANDALRGLELTAAKENLQEIIRRTRAKYPRVQIVVAGMQAPPNLGRPYTEEFRRIFVDLARENKAALIPFLLEGVGGHPELNQVDGIHPTPEGHRVLADNVWRVLAKVMPEIQEREEEANQ